MMNQGQRRVDVLSAAKLFSERITQDRIAKILNLSQPVVSRLISQARSIGLIEDSVVFRPKGIRTEDLNAMQARLRPKTLSPLLEEFCESLGCSAPGPEVRVFPTHLSGRSDEAYNSRIEMFGSEAAGYICGILQSANIVGVGWGITMAGVAKGCASLGVSKSKNPTTFIPLCGERLGMELEEISATRLAMQMNSTFNEKPQRSFSLSSVPAFIPREFKTKKEIETIDRMIDKVSASIDIFGRRSERRGPKDPGSAPLVERIDTVLTSVGSGKTLHYLRETAGIDLEKISNVAFGNICGVFIRKQGLTKTQEAQFQDYQQHWRGVSFDSLERCAERALHQDSRGRIVRVGPGVVVVAIGKNKAEIILECVRRGLITRMAIDQELADELERQLESEV